MGLLLYQELIESKLKLPLFSDLTAIPFRYVNSCTPFVKIHFNNQLYLLKMLKF